MVGEVVHSDALDFTNKVFRDFYLNFQLPQYQAVQTARGFAAVTWLKIERLSSFYFGAALGLPLLLALSFRRLLSLKLPAI